MVVSVDIETTGLDPDNCQILEIAAVVDDLSDPNPKPVDELPHFQTLIEHRRYEGEPYALWLNGRIFKMLADKTVPRMSTAEAAIQLDAFLTGIFKKDKINVAGKNFGTFDYRFFMKDPPLRKFADRWFRHRIVDIGPLFMRLDDHAIPGTEECMKRAGIEPLVTHEALNDCKDVIRILRVWAARQKDQK